MKFFNFCIKELPLEAEKAPVEVGEEVHRSRRSARHSWGLARRRKQIVRRSRRRSPPQYKSCPGNRDGRPAEADRWSSNQESRPSQLVCSSSELQRTRHINREFCAKCYKLSIYCHT